MRWSWKLGEVAGIGIFVHATFFIVIGWIALSHWRQGQNVGAISAGVLFILALFGCVLLHELGHALTAKKYGIKTRDITLLPIGGVARLERMPDDPKQELWVALAGPAVNVAIAVVLFVWLEFTGDLRPLDQLSLENASFVERLMWVNVVLVLFNMLPAFPMDGGRVLRAVLATRMDYVRATQIAAYLGQAMALLFGFLAFFGNPFLLFIALFVWIGAAQEASMAQMKWALGGIPVSRAMLTDYQTLSPDDTLARAVELILAGAQQDFPVVENGNTVGILRRADLLAALAQHGQQSPVKDVMRRDFQVVDSTEMMETALRRLEDCHCHTLPVEHNRRLVGLMTMENVGEFVMIEAALGGAKKLGSIPRKIQP